MNTRAGQQQLDRFAGLGAVDTTHWFGHWPARHEAYVDGDRLRATIERFGLSQVWLSHLSSLYSLEVRPGNDAVLRVAEEVDQVRPWGVIDPSFPHWQRELERVLAAGVAGVRLAPGHHNYALNEPYAIEACQALAEKRVPTMLVVRLEDFRLRDWRWTLATPNVDQVSGALMHLDRERTIISGFNFGEIGQLRSTIGSWIDPVRFDSWFINGPSFGLDASVETAPGQVVYGSGAPCMEQIPTVLQFGVIDAELEPQVLRAVRGSAEQLLG